MSATARVQTLSRISLLCSPKPLQRNLSSECCLPAVLVCLMSSEVILTCVKLSLIVDRIVICYSYLTYVCFSIHCRKQRDKATFSFHVNSEWAGGVKVAKNGAGLIKVWKQQLQQFRNVSPEMATAVVAQYSSPQLLLQVSSTLATAILV